MERLTRSQAPSPELGLVCASEKGVTAWLLYLAGWFLLGAVRNNVLRASPLAPGGLLAECGFPGLVDTFPGCIFT